MLDPVFCTASEIAQLIREREISACEVLDAHLQHIARHNPQLNAIATSNEQAARQRAKEADAALARGEIWGPLHGVPITIKDAYETAGLRTTSSFKPLAEYVPQRDATVVARVRAAGAVLLGKTNMPTLAMDGQTNSPLFGRTNNPWDVNRTPGGSTGGGSAAVAAGLSPLEIGSDLAGSLRIPAHYCGVFSFKPTEHSISAAGHIPPVPGAPESIRHMGAHGPVARSVGDLRLAFGLLAGPDQRDWTVPPVSTMAVAPRPLNEYRIAWTKGGFGGVRVSKEIEEALERVAQELARLGCHVEQLDPPGFDFEMAQSIWGTVAGLEVGAGMPAFARFMTAVQLAVTSGASKTMRDYRNSLLSPKMSHYALALTQRDALITTFEKFMTNWDVWLCPVTSGPAFKHCKVGAPIEIDGRLDDYCDATMAHTCVFNMTGSPVVVMPIGQTSDGLPLGMQLVGRRWNDMALLATAEVLSETLGGFRRPPGY